MLHTKSPMGLSSEATRLSPPSICTHSGELCTVMVATAVALTPASPESVAVSRNVYTFPACTYHR